MSTGAALGLCQPMSIIDSETAMTTICCLAKSSGVPSSCPRISRLVLRLPGGDWMLKQ